MLHVGERDKTFSAPICWINPNKENDYSNYLFHYTGILARAYHEVNGNPHNPSYLDGIIWY